MDFPGSKPTAARPQTEGSKFLTQAREQHAQMFGTFLAKVDEYKSVEEYLDTIEKASWAMLEAAAKASWKNGIARGQGRQASR